MLKIRLAGLAQQFFNSRCVETSDGWAAWPGSAQVVASVGPVYVPTPIQPSGQEVPAIPVAEVPPVEGPSHSVPPYIPEDQPVLQTLQLVDSNVLSMVEGLANKVQTLSASVTRLEAELSLMGRTIDSYAKLYVSVIDLLRKIKWNTSSPGSDGGALLYVPLPIQVKK